MDNPSIVDIDEHDLIDRILSCYSAREMFLKISGMPRNPIVFTRVNLRSLQVEVDGDVDMLVCDPSDPQSAVAIEVKRIKIGASSFLTGKPNKLLEIPKAVRQANKLAQAGFSRVFLYLIVVVDSREANKGEMSSAGATTELRDAVYSALNLGKLDSRVGAIVFELVQPMDDEPLGTGTSAASVKRMPERIVQPTALSDAIAKLLEGI